MKTKLGRAVIVALALFAAACTRSGSTAGHEAATITLRGDGGAAFVGFEVDVRGDDRIAVTFFRGEGTATESLGPAPFGIPAIAKTFRVHPERIDVVLADSLDRSYAIRPLDTATVASTVAAEGGPVSGGDQIATVTYRVEGDLKPSMYNVSVNSRSGVVDSFDDKLDVGATGALPIFVMTSADRRATIGELRRRYVGEMVYGYHDGIPVQCGNGGTLLVPSARITRIGTANNHPTMNFGGLQDFYDETSFIVLKPIEVTLDDLGTPTNTIDYRRYCPTATFEVAGAWDFERIVTLRRANDHRAWSAQTLAAIKKSEPLLGMTPEMVAYAWGFPTTYGSAQQFFRSPEWQYDYLGNTHRSVIFKNGHAISISPVRQSL